MTHDDTAKSWHDTAAELLLLLAERERIRERMREIEWRLAEEGENPSE
jgi:hypothetical protein